MTCSVETAMPKIYTKLTVDWSVRDGDKGDDVQMNSLDINGWYEVVEDDEDDEDDKDD